MKPLYYERWRPSPKENGESMLRKYVLFPNDDAVTNSLIQNWRYQPYMFWFLKDNQIDLFGDDVIDVGANNGNFAIEFSDLVGESGRVAAFEPQRIIYNQLCGNVFLNSKTNIYCHNVAIGATMGVCRIQVPDYFSESTDLVNYGDVRISPEGEDVAMWTIDYLNFRKLGLIKIDVQGFEPNVLDGAIKTINTHRPIIYIEVEEPQLAIQGFTKNDLFDRLDQLQYEYHQFYDSLDFVCLPKEKHINPIFRKL